MKVNKKQLGSNVRRGVLTGTVAGFFAGWLAFSGHTRQFAAAEYEAQQAVSQTAADLVLPPVPALPRLPTLPTNPSYRIGTGPSGPLPQLTIPRGISTQRGTTPAAPAPAAPAPVNAAPAPVYVAPAPAAAPDPVFVPLPPFVAPPPPPRPAPTTKASPPR